MSKESRNSYQEWKAIAINRGRLLVLAILGIIGVLAWHELHPVTITKTAIYEFTNGGTTFVKVAVDDGSLTVSQREAATEMFLRRYVLDREPVDHITEKVRYPRVMAVSNDEVGDAFAKGYDQEDSLSNNPRFTREVKITRSGFLADDIFQAELEIVDSWDGKKEKPQYWVASMLFDFEEKKIRYDGLHQNPLGLDVTRYSLVPKNETKKRKDA